MGPDVNSATSPVHGARNRKVAQRLQNKKPPDLFSQVRGLKSTNIVYSHSIVAGGLDVMS